MAGEKNEELAVDVLNGNGTTDVSPENKDETQASVITGSPGGNGHDSDRGPGAYIPSEADPFVRTGMGRLDPLQYFAVMPSKFEEWGVRGNIEEEDVGTFVRSSSEVIELFSDADMITDAQHRKATLRRSVEGKGMEQMEDVVIAEKKQAMMAKWWHGLRGNKGGPNAQGGTEL